LKPKLGTLSNTISTPIFGSRCWLFDIDAVLPLDAEATSLIHTTTTAGVSPAPFSELVFYLPNHSSPSILHLCESAGFKTAKGGHDYGRRTQTHEQETARLSVWEQRAEGNANRARRQVSSWEAW